MEMDIYIQSSNSALKVYFYDALANIERLEKEILKFRNKRGYKRYINNLVIEIDMYNKMVNDIRLAFMIKNEYIDIEN